MWRIGLVLALAMDIVIVVSFFVFAVNMFSQHLRFLAINHSTIGYMKWTEYQQDVLSKTQGQLVGGSRRNLYNWGSVANLRKAGLMNMMFWYPNQIQNKYEGYHWDRIDRPRECFEYELSGQHECKIVYDKGQILIAKFSNFKTMQEQAHLVYGTYDRIQYAGKEFEGPFTREPQQTAQTVSSSA